MGLLPQIKRRHKAIEEMREHEDLLHLLADPGGSASRVGDSLPPARVPIKLDGSKTDALKRLWGAQPSFAVQGPPGTGKTTLIQAFADRLLAADPSAQVLLTAHSHHTVDDVRGKLARLFDKLPREDRPLMLRLGAETPDEHGVGPVTVALLRRLKVSELARRMPPSLARRLERVLPDDPCHDEAADIELRTLQMLIQDAANLTFSTMNAPELEELSARGRRFDWSVVEEAGKAHGFDMAATLQLSHRLLLIGDHFQLPPFNSQVFKKLLGDPLRVRRALQAGRQFAPRLVDPAIAEEEEGREPFAARCDRWRRTVNLFGRFFEASLGDDRERPGPAATLTDQHRMHPHIADLVGRVFYPDQQEEVGTILVSPRETHERFESAPPFLTEPNTWLPAERVVWCDVPWRQKTKFAEGESDGVFSSPTEVRAVIAVLEQLRPKGREPCDIQVLSPYNDQLIAIREALGAARAAGRLAAMYSEPLNFGSGKRAGATVDEFQGSEADVVIVSLVRNNPLVPWKSVGFLKEANRMNVLLSRARHKLVIVGSWEFFRSRVDSETPLDAEYRYLGDMMKEMERAKRQGRLARIEFVP